MMDERSRVQGSWHLKFLCSRVSASAAMSWRKPLGVLMTLVESLLPKNHTMISLSCIVKRGRIDVWKGLLIMVDMGIMHFRRSSPRVFQSIHTFC